MPLNNKYAAAHQPPHGAGDARPTALQILKDEGLEGKLTDKVIIVTGASAGLGVETVKVLAKTGATVFAAARDLSKATKALDGIEGKIELLTLDLASLSSVRAMAEDVLKRSNNKVNILVNNAGVMAIPSRTLTEDGFEAQFGINHLGHFLLFQLLKQALLNSSTPSFHSRVVNLSSLAHRRSPLLVDDYNFENTPYNEWLAYGSAKTANLYMANAIERYYGSKNLHALAVHPGAIMTELARHMDPAVIAMGSKDPKTIQYIKSVEQGAATTVLAAIGKDYEGQGGKYLEDAGEWGPSKDDAGGYEPGYAAWAFNTEQEDRLWKDSLKFVGVKDG
ncbi:short-chain dehydrogenase/reductase-like protein [Pyrenochaeta sp. MPI-SDFR-AT-0127]|nr:short-chain dehydrogenase/reductase-like protein [Pyrenochaeta sp. MPI-SDFR-AT-0127]